MEIKYVGSSKLKLEWLEANHRQAREKDYSMTLFRTKLEEEHNEQGAFRWLVKPFKCTLREIEQLEKELIQKHKPEYNKDYDPVASSLSNNRYENDEVRYRGVYCFEV